MSAFTQSNTACSKTAFVFAGQGAQYPGMGITLYEQNAAAREVFDLCESIRPGTLELCFKGSQDVLNQTVNTQPCLFAMDLACAAALSSQGIAADGAAGFSLGEIAALAFCGIASYADAFRLVTQRGILMDACCKEHPGEMAAVLRLTPEQVERVCEPFSQVYPVNYNSPAQTVCAASADQMPQFLEAVTASGGRAIRLAVSGAFHSPFMHKAAAGLETFCNTISLQAPKLPIYANVTAKPYEADAIVQTICKQAMSPVLWQQTIENMIADGYTAFVEVGAGKTLSGLIKKINPQVQIYNVEDITSLEKTVAGLQGGQSNA